MTLITFPPDGPFTVDDVNTNFDAVRFSDPTSAYGLRRLDTLEVLVANNTALTNISTGVYQYTVTDPAGSPDYEYWIEFEYDNETTRVYFSPADDDDDAPAGESTLSETRNGLKRAIGRYLMLSRDSSKWGSTATQDVDDIIKSAERMFYRAHKLPDEQSIHIWSFLQPEFTLELDEDEEDFDLPADFGGFVEKRLRFSTADNAWLPLKNVPVGKILQKRQLGEVTSSSQPLLYAVNTKAYDQDTGQRFQLMVWPKGPGTVQGTYLSNPSAISDADPYPLGGQPHAETLRAAALASAELEINGERGVHWAKFKECLTDSIAIDRKLNTPSFFGYSGDTSSRRGIGRHDLSDHIVTYGGVDYS